jgi:hypothetical protein
VNAIANDHHRFAVPLPYAFRAGEENQNALFRNTYGFDYDH